MTAVVEGPFPNDVTREEESADPQDAVIFVGVCLALGIASRHLLRGSRVPYTVALLVLGVALGSIEYGTSHGLGRLGAGVRLWANINPDLLLCVFLPALLFESSFALEVHQIKRCFAQMVILAGPGVLISTFCLGTAVKLAFPYNWNWKTSLLLGGLLSATDPVAVVALLKDLGASKKLSTIIEGESLMNDGTAIVVYQLFYRMVLGEHFNAGDIIMFLSKVSLGAVAVGLALALISILWLGFIFNDTVIEISLTLAVSYIAYFTAQNVAEVSGVLSVMTLGMFYATVARTAFKGESQQSLHYFWEMVTYIANTLIFILSGIVIAEGVLHSDKHFKSDGTSWCYLMLLYVLVVISRTIVVGALYPALRYCGYGLEWKEAVILVWSGLRGAVALSLSLSVKRSSSKLSPYYLQQDIGTLFVFFTGGIVFLTLIINGSTTQFVLHFFGMDKLSAAKMRILDYTKHEMLDKALEAFGDLGDDEELGPADWPTVKRYINCLNNLEGGQVHPHDTAENENHRHSMNLTDIRERLLNGVQAAYWVMLEEGRINQTTAILLMQSVDEAMDLVPDEPLSDWKGLKSHVHFPSYYRFLQMSFCPPKLVTYFTVERLESACYICAAFLRAHRMARRQLHEFIGNSEIAAIAIRESEAEGEEARKFLEDVRVTFPQVLRVVKTRQVTYSILKHLSEYVQNLEKLGLLEEKEVSHLHDAVLTDLKRLLRNPPLVKMPKIRDMLSVHPLLGALPPEFREPLEGSTKETMKLRGVTLFREGSKPTGIWLISNGVVRWSSKILSSRHSLHPIFSHGSTLGLYEVLLGKPYVCDIVTDSVVHCFFIETEKILSSLRSPEVEEFLWQEAAIVVAKLLLPQIFEKMTMQELRTMIVEGSSMTTYLSGEIIEIPAHAIGVLLEGFIEAVNHKEDLISSPAALLSSHTEISFWSVSSSGENAAVFCHQGSSYQVQTRARVILFYTSLFEATGGLQRRKSASWLSHSVDLPKPHSREHIGLMSWPQSFNSARLHQTSSKNEIPGNSLSQRAMQLSIYGSMIGDKPSHSLSYPRSYPNDSRADPSHSLSYPRILQKNMGDLPLMSARSEGEATFHKSLRAGGFTQPESNIPPVPTRQRKASRPDDYSSEESGDELIVRIDSPSRLSFR
ncbi:sodium/hydrogen exchanger 8 isoform X2 [Aristolochia californica]|uniref:sodium/hydrogen exchanger 8 isoform X2 n=1 Tax=Aristolochia californica TaxID=171875 RepID=UPI0035DA2D70